MRMLRYTTVVLVALSAYSLRAGAQAPELKWGPAPPVFRAGAKMAVLSGDPGKSDEFTVRLDLPDGYTIAPHWHPTDENITVVSGTFTVGVGDKGDDADGKHTDGRHSGMHRRWRMQGDHRSRRTAGTTCSPVSDSDWNRGDGG